MRAALYARFSNADRQNARSCEDQLAVLREHAARRGLSVVATFQDDGISGAAMANRPGILAALAAGATSAFDILLVEDEDRIARNLGHLAAIRDELRMGGVTLATLHTDVVETMHIAFKGAFAEQYLVDLGRKTSRGMRANAERGLATGARKYGYRTRPGGETVIEPDEAEVIRQVFALFADEGLSGREIADRLNRARTPGPTGGAWNASTLLGSATRGNGLLRSEIYIGQKVWNRDQVVKDPRTGARAHRYRPPNEWRRTPVPHLRILDDALFARAQARLRQAAGLSLADRGNARKPGLFSGLLKCGVCGASYTAYSKTRLTCAAHREKGPSVCPNARMVDRAQVEARALEGLRTRLLAPDAVAAYVRAYHAAWAKLEREAETRRRPLERRVGELSRAVERLVDHIVAGTATAATNARLVALEADLAQARAELAAAASQAQAATTNAPVTLHPNAADGYARKVEQLHQVLADITAEPQQAQANRKLIDAVRGLVQKIEIIPDAEAPAGARLRLHGDLSRLLAGTETDPPRLRAGSPLVAGGRYSPAPRPSPAIVLDLALTAAA